MTERKQEQPRQPWFDQRDFIGLAGLALLGYGAWLVYPPAGFLAPGLVMCGVAIFGVRG